MSRAEAEEGGGDGHRPKAQAAGVTHSGGGRLQLDVRSATAADVGCWRRAGTGPVGIVG